jgi:hypothetical protein
MSDYCTLDDIRDSQNLPAGYTDPNGDYARAIRAASSFIDQLTGRTFGQMTTAEARRYLPTNSGYCIIDDLYSFTSLVGYSGETWTVEQDFYLLPLNADKQGRPWTAIRAIGGRPFLFTMADINVGWSILDGRVTVTGKFGWPAVPPDITQACCMLAVRYAKRLREAPFGVYSTGVENPAVRLARMDPDVASLLEPYVLSFLA